MNNQFVSIIIANYNGQEYLETCLNAILMSDYTNFEIYIIDDGSTDNSKKIVTEYIKKDPRIKLITNAQNYGAAASRNKAVKLSQGEVLVFLDNDTQVTPHWLTNLLTSLYTSEKVGACQALLLDFEKRDSIQNAGVLLWAQTGWGLPQYQWQKKEAATHEEEIIAISACLAVKKDVFLKTEGFDEQEAVVTEDLDLAWRIYLLGYTILLSPNAVVYHHTKPLDERKNLNHNAEKIYFHLTKNSLVSIIKNYEALNALKFFCTSITISYGRAILNKLKRNDSAALHGSLRATWWFLTTLGQTLAKRKAVQRSRTVSDEKLFKTIIKNDTIKNIYRDHFTQTELL
jgi:GT2 family glycosyltransferase